MSKHDDDYGLLIERHERKAPLELPIRTFRVRRYDPNNFPEIEELIIECHAVQYNSTNVLIFSKLRLEPIPAEYIVRSLNGWIDYEEIAVAAAPSEAVIN